MLPPKPPLCKGRWPAGPEGLFEEFRLQSPSQPVRLTAPFTKEGLGEGIKNSHPLTKQGWDTKYSTVPPWLRRKPSLIDALTGAPGRPFPTCGSEVVSSPAGLQSLFTNRLLSEHLSGAACLRRSLYGENLAHLREKVNPCGGKMPVFSRKFHTENQVAFLQSHNGHFVTFLLYIVVTERESVHILNVSLHNYSSIIT